MKLLVCARKELAASITESADRALLLEGSWPEQSLSFAGKALSLDDDIDGRFEWIDRRAADWAEYLAAFGHPEKTLSPAYLNALALRYYLVKLLRLAAWFTQERPLYRGDCVELLAGRGRDADYNEVLSQICRNAGADFRVRWLPGRPADTSIPPVNSRWRRRLHSLSRQVQPAALRFPTGPNVVLCGNPRLLDPIAGELLARGCNLWWLYDRFAVKSWLRWRPRGAGQLVCNSSLGRENRQEVELPEHLECLGVNLAVPIAAWLGRQVAQRGAAQTRLVEQIDAHFARLSPDALVLDEDATPAARAAVAVARRHGAASFVVQHGVPCCRFGFSPLAADRFLAWGRCSRRRLIEWGVPGERIETSGRVHSSQLSGANDKQTGDCPDFCAAKMGLSPSEAGSSLPPRVLLLTTTPPRDDRPDSAALNLTGRTYAEMLRIAFCTMAEMDGAELIVKLHPRTSHDPAVEKLRSDFPALRTRVVRRGRFEKWLPRVDCVLSCGSSAGVEAASNGLPVIQLVPPGSFGFPAHDPWGLAGTARTKDELRQLLSDLQSDGWKPASLPDPRVFESTGRSAAGRIADQILSLRGADRCRSAGTHEVETVPANTG